MSSRLRRLIPGRGPGRTVAITVLIAVIAGTVGWIVGTHVQSPATVAASHEAPAASPVTAKVVRRTLHSQVVTQSTIGYGQALPVTLTGTVAPTGAGGTSSAIVTKAPAVNSTVHEGDVLLEVSGRPVFALGGDVPMYRTIGPNDTGDDVDQLRVALNHVEGAGLAKSGKFDKSVQAAVKQLYHDKGYAATKAPGGISVASGEVLFFADLPRHLSAVTVGAGGAATGQVATVSSPSVYGYGSLGQDDAQLVKVGMTATMESDAGAITAKIVAIGSGAAPPAADAGSRSGGSSGDSAGTSSDGSAGGSADGADAAGIPVKFTLTPRSRARAAVGQALKTTIGVSATAGPVLTVPVSALFTRADGSTRVRVLVSSDARTAAADAVVRDVPVTAGLSVDGIVQVTPPAGGGVAAGDLVLISAS